MENNHGTNEMTDLLSNPFGEEAFTDKKDENNSQQAIQSLSEEQRKQAIELAIKLQPQDQQAIIQFGTAAQTKLSNFSRNMLDHVQQKDTGPIGDVLKELMVKLGQVNPDDLQMEKKGFLKRMLTKISSSVNETVSKYQKIGSQIDKIGVKLDHQKSMLQSDITLLEELFQKNKEYFDGLTIFIAAGEMKLDELRKKEIPELKQQAERSNDQMVVQQVNDVITFAERLEKRIHDLKISRQITIQSAPQIRLIQNMNHVLVEKIQSSILTTIPLWRNQVAIALTLLRQRKGVEAQKQVSKTTNELLVKNSEMLKTNSIETAIENERGLVDIDTLKKVQENLISTLEETIRIQYEGHEKRQHAGQELKKMEDQIKQKLLEMK